MALKLQKHICNGEPFFVICFVQILLVSIYFILFHQSKPDQSRPDRLLPIQKIKSQLQLNLLQRDNPSLFSRRKNSNKISTQKNKTMKNKTDRNKKVNKQKNLQNSKIETNQNILSEYLTEVRSQIENKKYYPYKEKMLNREGMVRIRFSLKPDGSVHAVQIIQASTHSGLNKAALKSIQKARPFPIFPKEITKPNITLEYTLNYFIVK